MRWIKVICALAMFAGALSAQFGSNATKVRGQNLCNPLGPASDGNVLTWSASSNCWNAAAAGSSMTYPGAGVANSTGSAWGTSYTVGTSANNLVQLNGSAKLPAVDASLLTNLPTPVKTRSCELHLYPVTSETISCYNDYGVTTTITAVRCYADTGSPTIRPIVTGGSSTSILSGDLTCGSASWANGSLQGTPTRSAAGTVDMNVVSASTANWIRVVITETLP